MPVQATPSQLAFWNDKYSEIAMTAVEIQGMTIKHWAKRFLQIAMAWPRSKKRLKVVEMFRCIDYVVQIDHSCTYS